MLHSDAKSLKERGDRLFGKKRPLDSRNQEIADHFYPERADFTMSRSLGADWAEHLMTGYPALVRRDLGNSLGAMLRPRGEQWFHIKPSREGREDHAGRRWLEWAESVMRRAMYDRQSMFTRATKEGDHDFSAFGTTVLSVEMNRRDNALLYRSWHLRDVAWAEDAFGQIGEVHRNWRPPVSELVFLFPRGLHERIREKLPNDPQAEVHCRHVMVRRELYDPGSKPRFRTPWVSLYIDCENDHLIEEVGSWGPYYIIPRWATLSGSQYAYSPATLVALPDARLIQAMTLTLLEAGEKAVNPPMVGVSEAIRGDLAVYPGGFTAVDADYDERLGEVLRPINQDTRALPYGVDVADRTQAMLREAFFLNKLTLPPSGGPEMTAFEVGQRVQEYIRQAMPLFEPMEHEYNGALCEATFDLLMREGAFGSADQIPPSLRGGELQFVFESPLAEMAERKKGQLFLESRAMLAQAAEIEPEAMALMDFGETLRDVLSGIGAPSKWLRSEEEMEALRRQSREQEQAAAALQAMQQGADVGKTLGESARAFADASQSGV